jgi:hypothetical protein
MDEADIYYVDTRNADVRDLRVRPGTITPARAVVLPGTTTRERLTYAPPPPAWPPGAYPNAMFYPNSFWNAQNAMYAHPPVYAQPPMYGQPPVYGQPPFLGTLGALFGGVNIGQVIDLVGQGFAALKALPPAPSSTGDVATDIANLTLYQRALAEHGKLDEQIRTGVHIVAKLLGG